MGSQFSRSQLKDSPEVWTRKQGAVEGRSLFQVVQVRLPGSMSSLVPALYTVTVNALPSELHLWRVSLLIHNCIFFWLCPTCLTNETVSLVNCPSSGHTTTTNISNEPFAVSSSDKWCPSAWGVGPPLLTRLPSTSATAPPEINTLLLISEALILFSRRSVSE